MAWASVVEFGSNASTMIAAAAGKLRTALQGRDPDLVIAFITPHFADIYPHLPGLLHHHVSPALVIGCSAGGVIGGGEEVENRPAISLTAACLPGVALRAVHTDTLDLPDEDAPPELWKTWLGLAPDRDWQFVVLADPFSARVEPFLNGLDYAFPASAKVGGLASGGQRAGDNLLVLNQATHHNGLVCLALAGNLRLDTIVAQGCRPIGPPLTVTRCERNVLLEVDGESPLIMLNRLFRDASEYDRTLMRSALFLGVGVEAVPGSPGDSEAFLIRNLIGADYNAGTMTVGALLREGQVVRFHLRDRQTSRDDLNQLLETYAVDRPVPPEAGALLFACLGRGHHLYGEPNVDSSSFLGRLGPRALGGFFCNGEIGPVGGATFIHGYTSSFGIFRPAR
jgi:small ligand-binding sensory domain FIST